jgi:hypothetical protein
LLLLLLLLLFLLFREIENDGKSDGVYGLT